MTMYVLERRVPRETVKGRRQRWEQYAVCGQRAPLERVLMGLGGTKEWRVRQITAAGHTFSRAA